MRDAVVPRAAQADVVIMAAAVADYAPAAAPAAEDSQGRRTRSRCRSFAHPTSWQSWGRVVTAAGPLLVGFAAETTDVVASARRKQQEKRVDLVVANDVSRADAGFEVDTNEVTLVFANGEEALPLQSKSAIAMQVVQRIEALLAQSPFHSPGVMSDKREQFAEHLKFFGELGVAGFRKDAVWSAAGRRTAEPKAHSVESSAGDREPS